jgi:hypothetical protein
MCKRGKRAYMEKRWIGTWALLPNFNHLLHVQQQAIDSLPLAQKKPWHYKTQKSSKVHTSPLIHKGKKKTKKKSYHKEKSLKNIISHKTLQKTLCHTSMGHRTCRKNKNTPQTLQKVYIPKWSSKQKKGRKNRVEINKDSGSLMTYK